MNINSWDVVFACSGAYINKQLASNPSKYIQAFSYEDAAISVSGTFGVWQIVAGGAGSILQFETPITKGSVTIKSSGDTLSLDGAVPLLQMQLKMNEASAGGSHTLVFNCTCVGSGKGDTSSGAVSVIDPDTSGKLQKEVGGAEAAALLTSGLANCMIAHASELSFIFASLIPTPDQSAAWLTPVNMAYCYQQPNDGSLGDMAILGVLSNREIGDLPRNIDSKLLLPGSDFGYVLAGTQFMQHIVMPALPRAYGGTASAASFRMSGSSIVLNQNFSLDSVKVGLIHYTPKVKSFSMKLQDTRIQCYLDAKTDITGLVSAYVTNSVTSNNQSAFNVHSRLLSFLPDPKKLVTSDKHIPWWESALGALTLGIMNAVIAGISLAIEEASADVVGSKTAQALGEVGPGLVSWHGQSGITITLGGLEDNVYMIGKIT